MSFVVAADAYDRFMGRYSRELAPAFAHFAGIERGMRVVDVGCGPGALTSVLIDLLGPEAVAGADPSEPFVEAARVRHPGSRIELAPAEALPFGDSSFDASLAQLVVGFMADPAAGVAEMARVTRAGGTVAACVWDHQGDRTPLSPCWQAVRAANGGSVGESVQTGSGRGELTTLLERAGLSDVREQALCIEAHHGGFDEWWEPFTLGVGPAGAYVSGLDDAARSQLRERCREGLGDGPFALRACAWAARGTV